MLPLVFASITGNAQQISRPQPVWWFGESAAANFNFYRGTTQVVNDALTTPVAFHKGQGVKPYFSLLTEYRPNKVLGGMLNVAYDGRGGKFDQVIAPCNCSADLSTNVSYLSIEPSVRIAPFSSAFYIFAGPTLSFNLTKSFTYTQQKQTDVRGDWTGMNSVLVSAQVGAGVDIPISKRTSPTQMTLSPFASFQTDFGHNPRSTETWSLYTIRTGLAFKFGTVRKPILVVAPIAATPVAVIPATVILDKEVHFSVRAPKLIAYKRQVKEIFPIRNSVFFDIGSTEIPNRYVLLSNTQATAFTEVQLQQAQPYNLDKGRSARQLSIYYNILNVIGDRMRANPQSTIRLSGSSDKNPAEGKMLAENVKQYLVNVFGISASRISTVGRDKPAISIEEEPGATKDIALLREDDRRVDIESFSPELLMQVGGTTSPFMKPVQIVSVQEDPLDRSVIFYADGASDMLSSWSVDMTDEQGNVQRFGPYTTDQGAILGKTVLGNNGQGNYKVEMVGTTKSGTTVKREGYVSLIKMTDVQQDGLRYSILFDFDRSKSIATYENFLTDVVAPLVTENATVIIHGHTDIIGDEKYNDKLSQQRANSTEEIIEHALARSGTKGVRFETRGYGKNESMSPFENNSPEKRFYNRTVIIDIIPAN